MKILVLGIGNVLLADEGVGVFFVKWFENIYQITPPKDKSVDFVDGGTLCMQLTPLIASYDKVFLVDCIDGDAECGDVFFFDYHQMPKNLNYQGSAHEVETFAMLNFMDMINDLPQTYILAIKPNRIEPMSFTLSDEVINGAKTMQKVLKKELESLGFILEQKSSISLQEFAKNYI